MCVVDEDQRYLGFGGTVGERRSWHWDGAVTGVIDQHTRIFKRMDASYLEGKLRTVLLVSL